MLFLPPFPIPSNPRSFSSTCTRFPLASLPSTPDESSKKRRRGRPPKSKSISTPFPQPNNDQTRQKNTSTPIIRPISPKRQFIVSDPDPNPLSTALPISPPDPDDLDESWLEVFSEQSNTNQKSSLHAPNGIPDSDTTDLLPELLPILSKNQFQASQPRSPQQKHVQQLLDTCFYDTVSMHRSSGREDNLKPFQKRKLVQGVCETCQGNGMTVCEYCEGQGYVDLGKDACRFHERFGDHVVMKPTHVMGTIYFCPLCGGLQKERCVGCLGTGIVDSEEGEKVEGAADNVRSGLAIGGWSFEQVMIREKDRIEIGVDGTIILRAKTRNRKKKKIQEKKILQEGTANVVKDDVSLSPSKRKVIENRNVKKTTDFVNTTDYQVGRRLRKRQGTNKENGNVAKKKDASESDE